MTLFLIILLVAILYGVYSSAEKKFGRNEHYRTTRTDCVKHYLRGCSLFSEYEKVYLECAEKNENHVEDINLNAREYHLCVALLMGYRYHKLFSKKRTSDYTYESEAQSEVINSGVLEHITEFNADSFEEWSKSPYYDESRNPAYENLTYEDKKSWFRSAFTRMLEAREEYLTMTGESYRCASTLDMVAKHYGLPTNAEIEGTDRTEYKYTCLGCVIYKHTCKWMKEQGITTAGTSNFRHFKTKPTKEDIKKVEEYDIWWVRAERDRKKTEELEKKYPWMNNKK